MKTSHILPNHFAHIRFVSLLSTLICISTTIFAQQVVSSSVTFKIKNMGITVDGSFGGFEAKVINFDPNNPGSSKLEATIQSKTINTDNSTRDRHLREEDYFDAEKYPIIKMSSTKIEKIGQSKFLGYFDLTIKGKTKQVKVPFTYTKSAEGYTLKGSFEMNRRDFGVGGSSWILSDELTVDISVSVRN